MRYWLMILVLVVGCQERPDLRNARSVTIVYSSTMRLYDHEVKITDPKDVKALTDAFRVKEVRTVWAKLAAYGAVEFHLADGTSEKFWCQHPQKLIWQGDHGTVTLQGRGFYELVNKLVSEKEGRPIDVLKNNPEKGPKDVK